MPVIVTAVGLAAPAFLGVGIAYPIRLDSTQARFAISSGNARIYQSIDIILNTDVNERPYLLNQGIPFGTRVSTALFENAEIASQILQYEAGRALTIWEPRIAVQNTDVIEVVMSDGGAALALDIQYLIRATNSPDNYVVPFRTSSPF